MSKWVARQSVCYVCSISLFVCGPLGQAVVNEKARKADVVGKGKHLMRHEFFPWPLFREQPAVSNEQDKYSGLVSKAQEVLGYESPFPEPALKVSATEKFKRLPPTFDFHVQEQTRLWNEFINRSYVTKEAFELLHDHGGMYPDLDRTFLYCFLQHIRPSRVLEIGAGESTDVAIHALAAVRATGHNCNHTVIEPYRSEEVPSGVQIIKQEMQEVGFEMFDALQKDDLLFIDSSHVVKPYGDTLTELVTILPRLQRGVYVHIHDIFLPDDYPSKWALKNYLYTEQWAVALLLSGSKDWEVIWSSHLMAKEHSPVLLNMQSYPLNNGQLVPNGGALIIKKLSDAVRI